MKFVDPIRFVFRNHRRLISTMAACFYAAGCATSGRSPAPAVVKEPARVTQPLAVAGPRQPLLEVTLESGPLKSRLESIAGFARLKMEVDWASLAEAGVHPDTTIPAVHLSGVTPRKAVEAILEDAQPANHLWSHVEMKDDRSILITSQEQYIKTNTVTRIYDIRDFFPTSGLTALRFMPSFGPDHSNFAGQICKLLTDNVAAESWMKSGGTPGVIVEIGGFLIIRQTRENQAVIQLILDQLRPAPSGT